MGAEDEEVEMEDAPRPPRSRGEVLDRIRAACAILRGRCEVMHVSDGQSYKIPAPEHEYIAWRRR